MGPKVVHVILWSFEGMKQNLVHVIVSRVYDRLLAGALRMRSLCSRPDAYRNPFPNLLLLLVPWRQRTESDSGEADAIAEKVFLPGREGRRFFSIRPPDVAYARKALTAPGWLRIFALRTGTHVLLVELGFVSLSLLEEMLIL